VMDLEWGGGIRWGELNMLAEREFSAFHFERANTALYFDLFARFETEARAMIDAALVLPAYDYVVKLSHIFNILDARGAISVTERTGYLARIRSIARKVALLYLEKRESLGFPLLDGGRAT
jgi:glycyl-tRNA synthetase alpha chain